MLDRRWLVVALLMVPALAHAQDGEDYGEAPELEQDVAELEPEPEAAPAPAELDGRFDQLMLKNAAPPVATVAPQAAMDEAITGPAIAPEVVVPLEEWTRTRDALLALRAARDRPAAPPVVLGAAEYRGQANGGALALTLRLGVTLGAPGRYKVVPLVGDDAVLVSASRGGRPLPVVAMDGYHVWITRETGEQQVEVELLVPARGPRGSIEFELRVPRTPVTRFSCRFPGGGLEPRIDGAIAASVSTAGGATTLEATLPPTTRVRLVGFKDLGAAESRDTKVYAETSTLLSIAQGRADVFSVVRYTILYGGTKTFAVALPEGTTVVAADGEGAFRWAVERDEAGRATLRGETAFPIRGAYEVSLRLSRELKGSPLTLEAPLPRAVGVEREHGWLAVEVPGRLRLIDKDVTDMATIDVRQLPPEVVQSSVTPILRAYRFHAPTARVALELTRLPEKEPASAAIDEMRANTVVSVEGKALTELKITLKNRLRPALLLTLPPSMEVRSTLLDGNPVKPSKNDEGKLMLPLRRSAGGERPEPFTLQVVLESQVAPLSWWGAPSLSLPAVDLPVSSLAWEVRVPGRNLYSRLQGEVAAEQFAGHGRWHRPVVRYSNTDGISDGDEATGERHGSESGAMPVRLSLPEDGVPLEYGRYWLPEGRPVTVSFTYLRRALVGPLAAALVALLGLAVAVGARAWPERRAAPPAHARAAQRTVTAAAAGALIAAAVLARLTDGTLVLVGLGLGGATHVVLTSGAAEVRRRLSTWWTTLPERWRARARPEASPGVWRLLARLALAATIGVAALITAGLGAAVLSLLSRPL